MEGGYDIDELLVIEGPLDRNTVSQWYATIIPSLKGEGLVGLDLSKVTDMDSAGVALCEVLRKRIERAGGRLSLVGASPSARNALSMFRVRLSSSGVDLPVRPNLFERVAYVAEKVFRELIDFALLVTDTFYFCWSGILKRSERIRWNSVIEQMVRIGLESLGIITLISFLVGLTVALQSAAQLRQFGANIYVANLIGVAMTREMGPLMTAILMAGRSGASIAAEIATMVITEEVDALRTMGIHPIRFLVVPRFLGITLTQPLLTVMSDCLGIVGGFLVAVIYLQLGAGAFYNQLIGALELKDIFTGLIKSVSFAWIIAFVAAHRGFKVKGGAEGVGIATTMSVVQAIFAVIAADAFFSLLFYFR